MIKNPFLNYVLCRQSALIKNDKKINSSEQIFSSKRNEIRCVSYRKRFRNSMPSVSTDRLAIADQWKQLLFFRIFSLKFTINKGRKFIKNPFVAVTSITKITNF